VPFIFDAISRKERRPDSGGKSLENEFAATQITDAAAQKRGRWAYGSAVKGFHQRPNAKPCCSKENRPMRHVDFSPFYRSTVGFDRLFTMLDSLATPEGVQTYPPYNIERTGEDAYRISMAVAGFSDKEISLEAHRNVLTIKGEKSEEEDGDNAEFLYRGIASRAFERRFQLADHVEVKGAELKNGLLHIDLKRNIPEELKPRKIAISTAKEKEGKQIEAKAA
jgi:molecular chaperone IbpA